ncbi:LysE family translocator [Alicyclobacillus tolerans]|uniref:LysE family translocator n=1 Tax=Alicyclobacillus tolerans TaxID=90970 RepID=UPI001F42975C|nr:LysE family transporter [Alicyclobacillus tolerans]MCF8566460.1 LysE family translocator [Alicyclobacillus tolerans]
MELFFNGFLLSLSLCLDLGIVNVATIKTGFERGFAPALLMGLGSSIGDLIYACLSMAGISLLLEQPAIRFALWLIGSVALGYLAFHMLRETAKPTKSLAGQDGMPSPNLANPRTNSTLCTHRTKVTGWARPLMTGAGLALSSPSAILWFATVGGSIIAAAHRRGQPPSELVWFFAGFFAAGVTWSALVAWACGRARRWLNNGLLRVVSLVSGVLFIYFALRVFLSGAKSFL